MMPRPKIVNCPKLLALNSDTCDRNPRLAATIPQSGRILKHPQNFDNASLTGAIPEAAEVVRLRGPRENPEFSQIRLLLVALSRCPFPVALFSLPFSRCSVASNSDR